MAIVRTLDSKFYEIDDKLLAGKEVDPKNLPQLPKSLPPPEGTDVEGHDHHHWYNWHNHHWQDHHHGR